MWGMHVWGSGVLVVEQRIDWLRLVRTVFHEVDIDISDTEQLIVRCPDYVYQLGRLLHNTSPRSVILETAASVDVRISSSLIGAFVDAVRNNKSHLCVWLCGVMVRGSTCDSTVVSSIPDSRIVG